MILPNSGKVLIQCNCNQSNVPVTIVNDTEFMYNKNPNPNYVRPIFVVQYVKVLNSDIFWLIVAITIVWVFFIYSGHRKDLKTSRILKAAKSNKNVLI